LAGLLGTVIPRVVSMREDVIMPSCDTPLDAGVESQRPRALFKPGVGVRDKLIAQRW